MWPWSELGIEPTDDTRAVKRAYAKLLKQTRPDENPEGFQRLHAAYKDALASIEHGNHSAPQKPLDKPAWNTASLERTPSSEPKPPGSEFELETGLESQPPPNIDAFNDNVEDDPEIIDKSRPNARREERPPPSADKFIDHQEAERNQSPLIRGGSDAAPPPAILDTAKASYLKRIVATMLDIAALALVLTIAKYILEALTHSSTLPLGIGASLVYPFAALVFEASRWQATPGKRLLGLKVVDCNLMPLTWSRSVARLLIFVFTTALLWKAIWLINAFLKGRLIHDRLSKSYVVYARDLPE